MEIKQEHIADILKGLCGALLSSIMLAGVQYVGSHIPQIVQFIINASASTATIIGTKK